MGSSHFQRYVYAMKIVRCIVAIRIDWRSMFISHGVCANCNKYHTYRKLRFPLAIAHDFDVLMLQMEIRFEANRTEKNVAEFSITIVTIEKKECVLHPIVRVFTT